MARTKKKRRSCSLGTPQNTENPPKEPESLKVENSPTIECQGDASSIQADTVTVNQESSSTISKQDNSLAQNGSELKSPILVCRQRTSTIRAQVKSTDNDSSMKENFWHQANAPEFRPVTPDNLLIPVSEIFSPPTQKQIRSTIRALFPNGPPPPPPVRPMRRPKKGDVPYIVNCTKRRRVPSPKSLNVFTGDKYGITSASNCDVDEPEEECTPKRARRGPPGSGSVSKSAFNSNTNEIAERLKLYEKNDRPVGRTPKEQPVGYMTKRSFSPLPSTSTDSETIMKNDKYFSESLDCDNFDIDDDDELPEVIWECNNFKKEKDGTHLSSLACKDIKKEKIEIEINEDMNNNNDDVIAIDDDFCEIQFDKFMPKEKILDYSDVEPKKEPDDKAINKKIMIDDYFPLQPKNQLPTTSRDGLASTTVFCVEDISTTNILNTDTQAPANTVSTPVLRASNKIASTTDTKQSDLVIEVPDVIEPINIPMPRQAPAWNEEVQFISEERIERPGNSNVENIDVQVVSGTPNRHSRPADLINELQQFLTCLTGLTAQYCKRKTKKKNKRTKSKENLGAPRSENTSLVVNDENTAPINISNASVCNENVPSVTQVQTFDSNSVIPSANSSPSKRLGECPICLENLPRGSIASTNCGHVFCLECIKQSIKTSGKRCPTCRKQLRGIGYHQVFL